MTFVLIGLCVGLLGAYIWDERHIRREQREYEAWLTAFRRRNR